MKPDTLAILNDPELLVVRDEHFAHMEDVFAGRDKGPGQCFVLYGVAEDIDVDPDNPNDIQARIDDAFDRLAAQADALRDRKVFRPLIITIGMRGVHFLDSMFHNHTLDPGQTWQTMRVKNPVGQLPLPDLATDPLWALARECTERILAVDAPVVLMNPPCLSCALNLIVNLYGTDIYYAMMDSPNAVRRDLTVVHQIVRDTHKWYADNAVPTGQFQGAAATVRCQPPGYGQIDGCSTQMVSPEFYADMIAPLDAEVLGLYPHGGMIHLCGSHTQHLATWRNMKELRSVQLCAGPNLEVDRYYTELRNDQIIYIGPTKDLSLDRILSVTSGRRIILAENLPGPLPTRR